jgi:hypothetical protein
MNTDTHLVLGLVSQAGMIGVALVAVAVWRWYAPSPYRWFWAGAGVWLLAVILKVISATVGNAFVLGAVKSNLPESMHATAGGLYIGLQSSVFEMGFALGAALIWRGMTREANRAAAFGVGAGAVEAAILGLAGFVTTLTILTGVPSTETLRGEFDKVAAVPLFWLIAPVERAIAIPVHVASRLLVLLGVASGRRLPIVLGFALFTLLDGAAGVAHLSGMVGRLELWQVEFSLMPFAVVSIPVIVRCTRNWPPPPDMPASGPGSSEQIA